MSRSISAFPRNIEPQTYTSTQVHHHELLRELRTPGDSHEPRAARDRDEPIERLSRPDRVHDDAIARAHFQVPGIDRQIGAKTVGRERARPPNANGDALSVRREFKLPSNNNVSTRKWDPLRSADTRGV
jgi:hypothetical protein